MNRRFRRCANIIPYTGSGVLTTALCLDKAKTKEILLQNELATPRGQVLARADDALNRALQFPLIVKLVHEGSSMGLSSDSIVDDENALRRRVAFVINTYQQPALVEEFIQGREFTVGVLGNRELTILPIVEITFDSPRGINLFQPDDPVIEMAAHELGHAPTIPAKMHLAVIPAPINDALAARIRETATRAYRALDCRDWCRMEMRLGADNRLYVLELNPIAGIDPDYLLPKAARAAGWTYAQLVNHILDCALERTRNGN
ncbi:MAG: D-alanine--D-alanine ligase [Chloroflexi bacterium]|nr:D-alanine--D-alanine ligase [Chloroflexota bacterium]